MASCENCGEDLDDNGGVCPCTCRNCKDFVYDHVLAYCQSYLDNCSVADVSKALEVYFNSDDVAAAREVLRRKYPTQLKESDICKVAIRRSSPNRSVVEANALDVTEAVYLLGQNDDAPKFVTFELKKLPVLSPVLAVTRTQAESVRFLEQKVRSIEDKLALQATAMQMHSDELAWCRRQMENNLSSSYTRGNANAYPSSSCAPSASAHEALLAIEKNFPPIAAASDKAPVTQGNELKLPAPWADAVKNDAGKDEDQNSSGWHRQRHERRRLRRASGGTQGSNATPTNYRRRSPALQGSASNTDVKASDGPNRDLWIFNVHKDMDDETLRKFIEDGGSNKERKVHVKLWQSRYHERHESKQFRLTISKRDYEYVYKSEFWPLHVSVRKYYLSSEERAQIYGKRGTGQEINS